MSSRIAVSVRIRPQAVPAEPLDTGESGVQDAVQAEGDTSISLCRPFLSRQVYKGFDCVLGSGSTQADTYHACASPVVNNCLVKGIDGAILAYGITGAGKSHSIWGERALFDDEAAWDALLACKSKDCLPASAGILPRAIHHIFDELLISQDAHGDRAEVTISMMQLYQEKLYDLLPAESASRSSKPRLTSGVVSKFLTIREDSKGYTAVPDANVTTVTSPQQALQLLRRAIMDRFTSSTALNEYSSRSHAIVQISVKRYRKESEKAYKCIKSTLTVVDLAGCERLKRVKVTAESMKEASCINKSIFCLGTVVHALAERKCAAATSFVPFRNSVLTRLLRVNLDGSNNTCILACVSPAVADADETYGTLQFALRAVFIPTDAKEKVAVEEKDETHMAAIEKLAFVVPTPRKVIPPKTPKRAPLGDVSANTNIRTESSGAHVTTIKSFLAGLRKEGAVPTPKESTALFSPGTKLAAEFTNTLEATKQAALLRRAALNRLMYKVDDLLHRGT